MRPAPLCAVTVFAPLGSVGVASVYGPCPAGAREGETGERGERVRRDPGVPVACGRSDVEGAAAGRAVEGRGAGRVHCGAGVAQRQRRSGGIGGIDLDDGRDRDGVADVVGADEGVPVAAGREPGLCGGADQRRGGAEGGARVAGERAGLAGERRGGDAGDRVGPVGPEPDRERAVGVVAGAAAAGGDGAVDGQSAAGGDAGIAREREVRRGRRQQRGVTGRDRLAPVGRRRCGQRVGPRRARPGEGEAGERGEAVVEDAGVSIGRSRSHVEGTAAGRAVVGGRAGRVDVCARIRQRQRRRAGGRGVDLHHGREHGRVPDAVGSGEGEAVAARGKPALCRRAGKGRGCSVARAGVACKRAVLARQHGGEEA